MAKILPDWVVDYKSAFIYRKDSTLPLACYIPGIRELMAEEPFPEVFERNVEIILRAAERVFERDEALFVWSDRVPEGQDVHKCEILVAISDALKSVQIYVEYVLQKRDFPEGTFEGSLQLRGMPAENRMIDAAKVFSSKGDGYYDDLSYAVESFAKRYLSLKENVSLERMSLRMDKEMRDRIEAQKKEDTSRKRWPTVHKVMDYIKGREGNG